MNKAECETNTEIAFKLCYVGLILLFAFTHSRSLIQLQRIELYIQLLNRIHVCVCGIGGYVQSHRTVLMMRTVYKHYLERIQIYSMFVFVFVLFIFMFCS